MFYTLRVGDSGKPKISAILWFDFKNLINEETLKLHLFAV